jgi:general secretion pathway protein G
MVRSNNERRQRTGFTLMEVLIVMAIIVIIVALGGVSVFRAYEDAKESAAQTTAYSLASAAQVYYVRFKNYPESLQQLATPPDGQEPYIDQNSLIDPWGGTFQYDPAGPHNNRIKPDVWTTTKNGKTVGNWPMEK